MYPKEHDPAASAGLPLQFFGRFEAARGGTPLPRTRTRKAVWLLALLTLRQQQAVDRSWLAGTLWPDTPDERALTYLHSSLYDLRCALGPDASRLHAPTPRAVVLDLAGANVDLLEFARLIERGDDASLQRAVALYRGPLLAGCAEEWVFPEREACQQQYLGALRQLAVEAMARDEPGAAVAHLRHAAAADPPCESIQRALMEALTSASPRRPGRGGLRHRVGKGADDAARPGLAPTLNTPRPSDPSTRARQRSTR
jgi:DNA-binding SARP family transcriptional activator